MTAGREYVRCAHHLEVQLSWSSNDVAAVGWQWEGSPELELELQRPGELEVAGWQLSLRERCYKGGKVTEPEEAEEAERDLFLSLSLSLLFTFSTCCHFAPLISSLSK